MSQSPDIFAQLNYRQYLLARTRFLKETTGMSLRDFVRKAGIKSPGLVKLVADGQRNLAPATAGRFARALGLKGREAKYFTTLVAYNQSEDPDVKMACFDRLILLRPRSAEFMPEKLEDRYFSRYHYVCIREMAALPDFVDDPQWIAERCFPKITPTQAREALQTLLKLGLLKKNDQGKLIQGEGLGNERDLITQSVAAYHFHESVLDKTRHALGVLPQDQRHYHALTLPLSAALLPEIAEAYREFRDKVEAMVAKRGKIPDEVFQMNFQIFPVTRKDVTS